ncbi:hypothetical protein [Mycobacterium sp. URHB0044]|jgi:hypothetical protein|uniref:hypothetical protein n=1 Tax=Mycobacterium sp. URHB0044 TaxID=1380386 RepID=UPI0006866AB7|nr:hypothetical protein [Mycobacterium sp. URHB0044]
MTSTADAIEVLTLISLLHRRTAPRLDDRQAAIAMATLWAELFSAHNLALPDLIAGVKLRAQHHPDAPEPSEIIEFARKVRRAEDSGMPKDVAVQPHFTERQSAAAAAIAACGLCDSQGYTGSARVCDHVDRREIAARGSALVRAELAKAAEARRAAAPPAPEPPPLRPPVPEDPQALAS